MRRSKPLETVFAWQGMGRLYFDAFAGQPDESVIIGLTFIFTLICLALGVWYGWSSTGSVSGTAAMLWIIVVLSILEVSLSFDNAVVNASVLKDMDKVWQRRFLTWGIAFAVF